ncbi:hypothetical protein QLQ15_13265 [Lysobacter sp. LF1]|uniref:Uncharacterized protein n=1 Tax=Lysobacter stagni TaxID=3045172 RepID=A0ABT6XI94_9GAMM|nr:hypothetical protein [Lysobacter sp. LF1]MDI9239875.1 hypothetical protein [Lysobacter sp. LF1]
MATAKEIFVADIRATARSRSGGLVGDLPDGGQHPDRHTLAFGPDGCCT